MLGKKQMFQKVFVRAAGHLYVLHILAPKEKGKSMRYKNNLERAQEKIDLNLEFFSCS